MTRGEFERLTERYRQGKCTPEELAYVEKWVALNADTTVPHQVFEDEAEAAATEESLWAAIREAAGIAEPKETRARQWLYTGIAAAVALVLITAGLFWKKEDDQSAGHTLAGLETYNTSVNRQRIILPDSSVAILAEGARILTSESYGVHTRTVHLTGEAFFEVRKNPKKPFLVYSGGLVTEVLGTSFHVKPELDRKTIEVAVVTGKVSVYVSEQDRNRRRSGVIINPNQKVVYNTELKTIRQDIVDDPKIVVKDTPESAFKFDEMPVDDVLAVLRRAYGVEIVVSGSELYDCRFTGNLNGFDLFRQLDYICDAIDTQYDVRGTTIFITGSGCGTSF